MSAEAISAVFKSSLRPALRLVALTLADWVSAQNMLVLAKVEEMQARTGFSERTIRCITGELCKMGLLELVRKASVHGPNVYVFHLEMLLKEGCSICTPTTIPTLDDINSTENVDRSLDLDRSVNRVRGAESAPLFSASVALPQAARVEALSAVVPTGGERIRQEIAAQAERDKMIGDLLRRKQDTDDADRAAKSDEERDDEDTAKVPASCRPDAQDQVTFLAACHAVRFQPGQKRRVKALLRSFEQGDLLGNKTYDAALKIVSGQTGVTLDTANLPPLPRTWLQLRDKQAREHRWSVEGYIKALLNRDYLANHLREKAKETESGARSQSPGHLDIVPGQYDHIIAGLPDYDRNYVNPRDQAIIDRIAAAQEAAIRAGST